MNMHESVLFLTVTVLTTGSSSCNESYGSRETGSCDCRDVDGITTTCRYCVQTDEFRNCDGASGDFGNCGVGTGGGSSWCRGILVGGSAAWCTGSDRDIGDSRCLFDAIFWHKKKYVHVFHSFKRLPSILKQIIIIKTSFLLQNHQIKQRFWLDFLFLSIACIFYFTYSHIFCHTWFFESVKIKPMQLVIPVYFYVCRRNELIFLIKY